VLALALVMGLQLELADFRRVLRRPGPPPLGVADQISGDVSSLGPPGLGVAPAAALAMGLILVGCCLGGWGARPATG
jgi:bile acid:Na+ symporter, BASS family